MEELNTQNQPADEEKKPVLPAYTENPILPAIKSPLRKKFRGFPGKKESGENMWTFWLDIALNLIIIIGMVVIIRTFIISPFQVFGSSMCNTFNFFDGECNAGTGEYLIVNKFGIQNFFGWQVGLPERGDVIVFHPPLNDQEFFIKRVIGLPGETVKLQSGDVYVYNDEYPSGFKLDEDYLSAANQGNTEPDTIRGGPSIFEIPEGNYLVFGDNRIGSSDARSCFRESIVQKKCGEEGNTPFLALDHIEGKAWVVLWPLNRIGIVDHPTY